MYRHKKNHTIAIALSFCAAIGFSQTVIEEKKPDFKMHGSVQIQIRKELYDNNSSNNLDQFWGRANFGATVNDDAFAGKLNIQAYPGGFGYEVLTGTTFDTTGQGAVVDSKTGIPNFQIEEAWVQYTLDLVNTRVGRFYTNTSKTYHFGNYINQNAGGMFMSKTAYFNALEFSNQTGVLASSIILSAGDKNLNTGSLRIYEKIAFLNNSLVIGAGYFSNIFDRIKESDATLSHRFAINGDYTINQGLMPYFELGIIQNHIDKSWDSPILMGCQIPASTVLDFVAVEMEYSPETIRKDNPVGLNISLIKKASKHATFFVGLSTSTYTDSFGDIAIATRFSGAL